RWDASQLARALRRPVPERYRAPVVDEASPTSVDPIASDAPVTEGFKAAPLADLPPADDADPQWPDPA
nr:hypothetical protein [Gemmatimonadaceae bacterium]